MKHALSLSFIALVTISRCYANQVVMVTYVSKNFEVRDNDAPTKYVFAGDTRVAHVTGSLSGNPRVQRLRVYAGWNLCSLAVVATNAFVQLSSVNGQTVVTAAYKWVQSYSNFTAVSAGETLPAGTVIWLNASANAILSMHGTYAEPVNVNLPAGNSFVSSAGLEAWSVSNGIPASVNGSIRDPLSNDWQNQYAGLLQSQSAFPSFIPPGSAVYIQNQTQAQLNVPDSALRIEYYHEDHIGSSACASDAGGRLTEETEFYPFGQSRSDVLLYSIGENYQFTQKERDKETGLAYFECRYLNISDARFSRPDPFPENGKPNRLGTPQRLNPYSYVANRPSILIDPTGEFDEHYDKTKNELSVTVRLNPTFVNDTATWTAAEQAKWKADAKTAIEGYYNKVQGDCDSSTALKINVKVEYTTKGADVDVTVSHDPTHRSSADRANKKADLDIADPYPQAKGAADPQVPIVHEVGHLLGLHHPGGANNSAAAYAADTPSLMGAGATFRLKDFQDAFCNGGLLSKQPGLKK